MSGLHATRMQWALFTAQVSIAGTALGFSMAMLLKGHDPGMYLPIITGIIGYFMPAPKLQKKDAGVAPGDVEQGRETG